MKIIRISSILTASAVVLALAATSPAAHATTVTYTENVSSVPLDGSTLNLSLSQFNDPSAVLDSVTIVLTGTASTQFQAALYGPGFVPATTGTGTVTTLSDTTTLTLTGEGPNVNLTLSGNDTNDEGFVLKGSTVGGPNSYTFPSIFVLNGNQSETIDSDLSDFIGSGLVDFTVSGVSNSTVSGTASNGDLVAGGGTTTANAKVEVIYTYAPEPGTLFLFGTGLLGLAFLVRRKHLSNS